MRSTLEDEYYEVYEKEPKDDNELNKFIEDYITEFDFYVNIISGNRILFETADELMLYFKNNIDNVPNDNLYDFLLSLSDSNLLWIDYNGDIIKQSIQPQHPYGERVVAFNVDFTEESCKCGKYQFIYNNKGIDTLYNSKYIEKLRRINNG